MEGRRWNADEKVSIIPYIKQTCSLTQRKEAIFRSSTSITTGTWPRTTFPSTKPHREQNYSAVYVIRLCAIIAISVPSPFPISHLPSYTRTREITLSMVFAPLSMFKFNMYAAMTRDNPWSQMMGGADPSDEEQDTVKV